MQPSRIQLSIAAALVAVFSSDASAQAGAERQPTVVVTANRIEQDTLRSLAAVTVLDRAAIEASQTPDLISLLARQPGLDIARTGGPGSASTLFVRGTNANHVLVLVDGVRVAATGQGVFDFAHLPIEQIERIEIVRGPRAAIWGSDAIGGVVQVFTREPANSTRLRVGSYGRREAAVSLGQTGTRGSLGLTAGYAELDGFSASNEKSWSFDPDDDGYRNRNLGLRGDTLLGTHTLGFNAIATDADVEFDQGLSHARNRSGGVNLSGPLGAGWNHALQLGHAREDLDTPTSGNGFDSRRTTADWVNQMAAGTGTLSFGLNWQREQGRSHDIHQGVIYDRSRNNRAGFLGYAGSHAGHDLEAAVRHDDNGQFGSATTGSAGWGWWLSETARLRASWGQGFRAPNLNELYSPGFGGAYAGNPALQPERSNSIEAGADFLFAASQRLSINAWRTRISDMISFGGPNFQAINTARVEIEGVELEYGVASGPWQFTGNATWQDPRNADTGSRLLRRPGRKASAALDYRFDTGASLGVETRYASQREDFDGSLPSYTLLDLRASLPLGPQWRVETRLENLTDRDYELASGYNTPGRSWLLSLVWNGSN